MTHTAAAALTFEITRLAEHHAALMLFCQTGNLPVNFGNFAKVLREYQRLQKSLGVSLHNEHFIPMLKRDYQRLLERNRAA
jgi:hypothetical protein